MNKTFNDSKHIVDEVEEAYRCFYRSNGPAQARVYCRSPSWWKTRVFLKCTKATRERS